MTLSPAGDAMAANILLKPSITVEESYDSNPNLGSVQNAKEDFITSVLPQIALSLYRKGLSMSLNYGLNMRLYSNEPELNYISHSGKADSKMDLSEKTSITLSDSISYTKDSLQADNAGIQTSRVGILSNTAAFSLSQRVNQLNTVTLRGSDSFSKFDDPGFIDSRTDSAGIELSRELTPLRSVNVSYTYTNFMFENNLQNNLNTNSFQAGIIERLTNDTSLNLAGGIVYFGDISTKYDWTVRTGLSKRLDKSFISIGYSRGVTTSSGLTDEINISDRGAVTWSQTLAKSLNMTLAAGYSENNTETTANIRTKSYDASIRADWTPNPMFLVGLGYSRFQQWAEGTLGNDLTRDQLFISVTALSDGWRF